MHPLEKLFVQIGQHTVMSLFVHWSETVRNQPTRISSFRRPLSHELLQEHAGIDARALQLLSNVCHAVDCMVPDFVLYVFEILAFIVGTMHVSIVIGPISYYARVPYRANGVTL